MHWWGVHFGFERRAGVVLALMCEALRLGRVGKLRCFLEGHWMATGCEMFTPTERLLGSRLIGVAKVAGHGDGTRALFRIVWSAPIGELPTCAGAATYAADMMIR